MANDRGLCRFGIITSRAVGNAPTRNTLRRRIRAIASEVPDHLSSDVVIRVQPAAAEATWNELREDIMAHIKQAINA
jgi:ribonuclease P protein component